MSTQTVQGSFESDRLSESDNPKNQIKSEKQPCCLHLNGLHNRYPHETY